MIQIIIMSMIFMAISLMLMTLNYMISKKSFQDREKISPFECGFDPMSPNHMPFSTQFFLISLIFLIFDIEIALLIPLIYMFIIFNLPLILTSFLFMMILNYSLYIEYSEQSIDWKI